MKKSDLAKAWNMAIESHKEHEGWKDVLDFVEEIVGEDEDWGPYADLIDSIYKLGGSFDLLVETLERLGVEVE